MLLIKKLLKNKKVIMAGAIVATLAISGSTYLWFTNGNVLASNENMGRLVITTTETSDKDPDFFYEPGQQLDLSFKIDNEHAGARPGLYIPGFVKADFANGKVEIWSDEYGNEISPILYDINKDHLNINVDVKTVISDEGLVSCWYFDPTTGIYYVLLDPGMISEPNVEITFKGREMGNVYQGSVFKFNRDFIAVNVQPDAILDVHNVDLANLLPIDENGLMLFGSSTNSITAASNATGYDYYMGLLYDRMSR